MKNLFLGLALITSLVASAYSFGCQQMYNNRLVKPLVDIAPKWTVRFPRVESIWDTDLMEDPWHTINQIANEAFNTFQAPIQHDERTKPTQPTQCRPSRNRSEMPLDDAQVRSNSKFQHFEDVAREESTKYDDWSEDAELLRQQQWEKKLQEDIQREQQRREEWYKEKVAKVRKEQEERERIIAKERQRQHDLIRKQEEEILRRQEEARKKRQEMEARIKREQWLEEKRREEERHQAEERAKKEREEVKRVQEELRREREAERQEQIKRERWLEQKRVEEQQRHIEELRRKEEQRAEERFRILEEKQKAKQRELEEKIRQQEEQDRIMHEREHEKLKQKREQWSTQREQQTRQQHNFQEHDDHHFNSDFKCTQNNNHHQCSQSQGFETTVYDLMLAGYYPADLSVEVKNGILFVEGSHTCGCEEDCFMREFERKTTIPSNVDTKSLSASLDSEGHFKVTGIQYRHPVQQNDIEVPVSAIQIPHQMPQALKYCTEKKPTYKLAKIDPSTGSTHKRNAYKFERRKTHFEDDGVTIEVAEDFA